MKLEFISYFAWLPIIYRFIYFNTCSRSYWSQLIAITHETSKSIVNWSESFQDKFLAKSYGQDIWDLLLVTKSSDLRSGMVEFQLKVFKVEDKTAVVCCCIVSQCFKKSHLFQGPERYC